jgi:DNA-binding NarL/FixJ family response regulator
MANTISQRNFIRDRLINNTPKVVILEDMSLVREEIQQFIENELGWQVIIAKNRNEAVKLCESQEAEFYILDIKLGNERSRSQEGMDTAEEIKAIDENVFVSIFSDYSQSQEFQKRAKKVGVNYFQAKSSPVHEGVSRIAIEMLLFQKNLLDDIFQKYLHSSTYLGVDEILKIVNKIKEVNNKLEDIQKLERSYRSYSANHPIFENSKFAPNFSPIEEDENIREYEARKQDPQWREKYQNRYVAFAHGTWLKDVVADDSKDLLNQLRNSEYKGKSIFYKKVPKNNVVGTQGSDKFIEEEEFYELPMSFYNFYPIVDIQGSDKFIEEEEVYELPISFYDFYPSEDEV